MPEVFILGEIVNALDIGVSSVSVTWTIITGNSCWNIIEGATHGETQICNIANGKFSLNHPIDIFYDTSSSEGWPFIVCEVWDRSNGIRSFQGCGSMWLPTSSSSNKSFNETSLYDVIIWKPVVNGFEDLKCN